MNKAYKRINWENRPSTATPMNETNMNKMDYALDVVDTRVVELYNQKDAMALATANANKAADSANSAATSANTAAANANEAAQAVLDEKYILTATTEMVRSGTARPTAKGNAILEKLMGSSWQRKLTGKNLYDMNDADMTVTTSVTVDEDGWCTVSYDNSNGGSTAYFNYFTYATDRVKESTNYAIVTEIESISAATLTISSTQNGAVCQFNNYINKNTAGTTVDILTTVDNFTDVDYLLRTFVSINAGAKGSVKFRISVLEDTTVTADTFVYEPYCGATPSPNPEFQQTIRSTGDMGWFDGEWLRGWYNSGTYVDNAWYLTSKTKFPCKENDEIVAMYNRPHSGLKVSFFDENNIWISTETTDFTGHTSIVAIAPKNAKFFVYTINEEGITAQNADVKSVTINGKYAVIVDEVWKNLLNPSLFEDNKYANPGGTITAHNDYWITGLQPCKPNTKYTRNMGSYGSFYDKNRNVITNPIITTDKTFTTPSNAYYMCYCISKNTNVAFGGEIQLEESDTVTPYTPYTHKRTYIPISEPLRAIGDVKDELVPVDGWYKVLRQIERVILNDKISYSQVSNSNVFFCYIYNYAPRTIPVATHLIGKETVNANIDAVNKLSAGQMCFRKATDGTYDRLYFATGHTTLEELKAYLAEKTVIVDYELATPYYEDLDQTPFYNLQSFDEVTHVSIAGLHEELEPTLTMRFPRHEDGALVTTSYCNSKKAEIRMDELAAAMLALGQT